MILMTEEEKLLVRLNQLKKHLLLDTSKYLRSYVEDRTTFVPSSLDVLDHQARYKAILNEVFDIFHTIELLFDVVTNPELAELYLFDSIFGFSSRTRKNFGDTRGFDFILGRLFCVKAELLSELSAIYSTHLVFYHTLPQPDDYISEKTQLFLTLVAEICHLLQIVVSKETSRWEERLRSANK